MTTFVGPCKLVAVSLLAYETLARINLQPFFLPPNLQNIKFKLRHVQSKGLTSAIWSKDSGNSFRIFFPITWFLKPQKSSSSIWNAKISKFDFSFRGKTYKDLQVLWDQTCFKLASSKGFVFFFPIKRNRARYQTFEHKI